MSGIRFLIYVIAQMVGAFLGALVVYLNYYDALNKLGLENGLLSINSARIFTTFPKDYVSISSAFFDQVIGTTILIIAILAITDKFNEKYTDINLLPVIDTIKKAFKRAESILKDENSVIIEGHCHTAGLRAIWAELAKKYTAHLIFVEVDPGISLAHIFNYAAVERANNEHVMLYPDSAYYTYKSDLEQPDAPLIYHPKIQVDDVIAKFRF
jgi:hypothetical protein